MIDIRISFLLVVAVAVGTQCDDRTESQAAKSDQPALASAVDLGEDKRGHIFRYGRANVFRYGKRAPSVFRYGKRASVFRYGKREDDVEPDDGLSTLFPKRIFRYGKRMFEEVPFDEENLDWNLEHSGTAARGNAKRKIFRYGKRGEDFGEEEEDDEKELEARFLLEKSHTDDAYSKERDEKRPIFRYGRSIR